jgi:coproporphyrinogen III oxidase
MPVSHLLTAGLGLTIDGRNDEMFMKKNAKGKAFHVGSNSSCRQHIRSHFNVYKEWCEAQNLTVHHHAIPLEITRAQSQLAKGKQMKLDRLFPKAKSRRKSFSWVDVLDAVAQFIVGDNQVRVERVKRGKISSQHVAEPYLGRQSPI